MFSLFRPKKKPSIYDNAVEDFRKAIWERKLAEQRFHYADEDLLECAILDLEIAEKTVSLAHKKAELSMNY